RAALRTEDCRYATRPRGRHPVLSPTPGRTSRTRCTRPARGPRRRRRGGSDGCSLLGPLVEGGVTGGETAGDQRLPVLAALRCDSGAVQPDPRPVVAVAALLVGGPVAVAGALVVGVVGFGFVPAGRPLVEDAAHGFHPKASRAMHTSHHASAP